MRHGWAIGLAVFALVAPTAAAAEENIYAGNVEHAQQRLDGARDRYDAAAADIARVQADLPAASAKAARLRPIATRRSTAAGRAVTRANSAETAERKRRDNALREFKVAQAAHWHAVAAWRTERSGWISITALLVGCALALTLAGAVASRRTALVERDGEAGRERAANRAGLALAAAVTLYLCGLLGALRWADAWSFSWWPVVAAAAGVVAIVGAIGVGWAGSTRVAASVRRLGRAAPVPVVAVALASAAPGAVAAGSRLPPTRSLPSETVALVEQARTGAPMPARVQALRRMAEHRSGRASVAESRYQSAADDEQHLLDLASDAEARKERAARAIDKWSDELSQAQKDFDGYQELLEPDYDDDDFEDLLDDYDVPDYDPPDLDDVPSYPYPTTEDFGSGTGSVGQCADGTYSDSIGRPGACSHHGGVG